MDDSIERSDAGQRPGETRFPQPESGYADAGLVFIGRIRSPWTERSACPKNMAKARETGRPATVELDAPWRAALAGVAPGAAVHLLTWLDRARRDLALQMPRHAEAPRGTFSLRSPVRPNPIGLHLVRILSLDIETGRIGIDAIDALDGTPLLDIKPYFATVDVAREIGEGEPGWMA
ncbi:SAM-dependent methyltransferase [Mangrovicella endophytica]|uniref:SAM-dependent methyltransferase n=1 Tax=Mangrovicella endophytica TaxID=2066697 RepID=UPI000C9EBC0C|nr:SAM-dependent methyltransferase [Mangrovicella endophytica]